MTVRKYFAVLTISVASLTLSACDTEFISVCYSCLESDPAEQISEADIKKIEVIGNGTKLPANARNVYYYEECGIDCIQHIRFDLPTEEAIAYAELVRPLVKGQAVGLNWPEAQAPQLSWWLDTAKLIGAIFHSRSSASIENDPFIDIMIESKGDKATVYLKSWNM